MIQTDPSQADLIQSKQYIADTTIPVYPVSCYKWEEVSSAIYFVVGHNRYGVGRGPGESRYRVCVRNIVRKYRYREHIVIEWIFK